MKETGILNAEIASAISRLGHMDEMIISDAGFAAPRDVPVIDISLTVNKPTVLEVMDELLKHFSVEKAVLAEETRQTGPTRFADIVGLFPEDVEVEVIPHTELKRRSREVKVIIRTGDFTSYSNVLLVSGAGPRWYSEVR